MRAGDKVVVGLSGGRDSVAYLTLLERTRERLPELNMTAVTITGLPDWEEPATFAAARESGERLGIEQVIVTAADVERLFKLKGQFVDAMNEVVAGESNHLTMVIGHQMLRRTLEEAGSSAERRGGIRLQRRRPGRQHGDVVHERIPHGRHPGTGNR
jgi:NH3-dependent NAD+ synthetase